MANSIKKSKSLFEAISGYLYEQPQGEETPEDSEKETNQVSQDGESNAYNQKDLQNKDIDDMEQDDLEDEDDVDEGEVAISVKLNSNIERGGEIKLVSYQRLSTINSIGDLLQLFNIDPNKVHEKFENQLQLTIQSPISDFEDEKYTVRLMDGYGEIAINRDNFNKTISKTGSGEANLGAAAQQQLSTGEEEHQVDLSYLEALNFEFRESVKDEFFSRILAKS